MKFKAQDSDESEINLTSLIDVVFLLLIFFMVTTTFEKDSKIKVELPTAATSKPEAQDNILELLIDSKGHYYVDNKEVLNTKPETLFQALSLTLDKQQTTPSLVITADANANYQSVITAMDIAGRLRLTNFSLATTQTERKK